MAADLFPMHGAPRRTLAVAVATAGLTAALLSPAGALAADGPAPRAGCTAVADVDALLDELTTGNAKALLADACPADLAQVLRVAGLTQLEAILSELRAADVIAGLVELQRADDPALAGVIASIAPEYLRSVLDQPAGTGVVVAGLTRYVADITGTSPMPEAVGELLAQVEAVLDAGAQADPAALDALLGALVPLLSTARLDPERLAALQRAVAGSPAAAGPGGDALLAALGAVPAPGGGGDGDGAGDPADPDLPDAAGGAGRASAAYRGRITRIAVARNRRSARVRLRCPRDTPGCVVALQRTRRRSATARVTWVALLPGQVKTVRVKLPVSAALRLTALGGRLAFTATTVGSSLPSTTRTIRVRSRV